MSRDKSKPRKKTLANGKLRPAQRRYHRKKNSARRKAWLANFAPGARDRFFNNIELDRAVFLAAFAKETGLERADAAATLERTASERRWMKLRTVDGTVVGIGPPKVSSANGVSMAAVEKTFWNGEPCVARKVRIMVADAPWISHYWARDLVGTARDAVEVTYNNETFYLDDEDYEPTGEAAEFARAHGVTPKARHAGGAWAKVTVGHGSPAYGHSNVAAVPGSVVPR